MADILSTSYINNLVDSFTTSQTSKLVNPLQKQKTKYQNLSTAYTQLSSKLVSFKSLLTDFTSTGTSSLFRAKTATTSNDKFVSATVNSSASAGNYSLRVNQLAKSDMVLSQMLTAGDSSIISGTHTFQIKTGDGSTGEYISNVEVEFDGDETTQTIMEKVRDAINTDKAVIESSAKTATDTYSGGPSSFIINIGGTETTVNVNGGGTYADLMTEMAGAINSNVSGVVAEVISNSGQVQLSITVSDNTKYISISNESGADLVSDLSIGVSKEKGASGIVTASAFAPNTGMYQFSLTAKESGLDNRIKDIHDISGTALAGIGLNLNTTRTAFDQDLNTAGFLYSDITSPGNLLNAKVNFNGINVQRNSNSIDDLAVGVTFSLKSVTQETDPSVNITTSIDVAGIREDIQGFLDKFNTIYTYLKENSGTNSGERGIFSSDAIASSLVNLLKSVSYGQIEGFSSDTIDMLSKIGITFDSSSGLSITDGDTLEDQIENNLYEVESIFNDADNGIANKLYNAINPYTGTGGFINNARSSADTNISTYSNKIKSAQTRIDRNAESLREKYQTLQAQLSSMYSLYNSISSSGFFTSE